MCYEPLQGSLISPIEFTFAILSIIALSLNDELYTINRVLMPITLAIILMYCAFRQKSHFDKLPNAECSSLLSFIGMGSTSYYSCTTFPTNELYLQYMSFKWDEALYRSIPLAFIQLLAFYRISLTVADNFLEGADLYKAKVDWYTMYCPFIGGCISLLNGMYVLVYYYWKVKNDSIRNKSSRMLLFCYMIFLSCDIILRTVMHSLVIAWFEHSDDFTYVVTRVLDWFGVIYCVYIGVIAAWHSWFKKGSVGVRDTNNKSSADEFICTGCIMSFVCILCSPSIASVLEDMHRYPGLYVMYCLNFGAICVYVACIIVVYFRIAFSNGSDEFLFATVVVTWVLYVVSGLCIFLILKPCCADMRPVGVDGDVVRDGGPTMVNGNVGGSGSGVELQISTRV